VIEMKDLSLNVLAVTVFAMTASILITPMLNIPAAVPVVGILGILTIAAFDTLAWQSRGATIFLDSIARFSPEHRDRVTHHEAGHFFVAHKLGFPVTDYSLSAWQAFRKGNGGQGGVQFDASDLDAEMRSGKLSEQMLDRLCMVWMAGIAAEQLIYGDVEGGEDDRFTLNQALGQMKLAPSQAENKQRWATLQAKNLLESDRASYESLVQALGKGSPVEECCAAISESAADK
jgi:hypothetical protein